MLFARKIEPIALDIGSTYIKLVQLKGSGKSYSLSKFGMVPLPPEVIVEGAVMDADRVSEAIKELLASQKVKTKECGAPPFRNPGTTMFINFIYLEFFSSH